MKAELAHQFTSGNPTIDVVMGWVDGEGNFEEVILENFEWKRKTEQT